MRNALGAAPLIALLVAGLVATAPIEAAEPDRSRGSAPAAEPTPTEVPPRNLQDALERLTDQAQDSGTVLVIARLDMAWAPGSDLSAPASERQATRIARHTATVAASLAGTGSRVTREFSSIPYVALELSAAGVVRLATLPITGVVEDRAFAPTLGSSIPVINVDDVWSLGYTGAGKTVAVLDTGVQTNHPFLGGRVIGEACFSIWSSCPNGQTAQLGTGAGAPCTYVPGSCRHGTHVAGIAAGNGGVAKGAGILAIQVFSQITNPTICGSPSNTPCARSYTSDQMAALEFVLAVAASMHVASANLSLGGGMSATHCDSVPEMVPYKALIDELATAGVATVIASGNDGYIQQVALPACISSAIAVGATTDADAVAIFSNAGVPLDLLAPGVDITSSIPGNGMASLAGTSMAAPHVAGAFALLAAAAPSASIGQIFAALYDEGVPIPDVVVTRPRIDVLAALQALPAVPSDLVPTISDIANQTTPEDTPKGPIAFTVGDAQTAAASLTLTKGSSNTTLIPTASIVFGGSGANRTVTITPAANASGSSMITITVSDGALTASDTFVLTVTPVDDAPTISNVANQSTTVGVPSGPIAFTVGDPDGPSSPLTVAASSSNKKLVPDSSIAIGGSGSSRTVTVTPAFGRSGTTTITLTVSDGTLAASGTFTLVVSVPAATFTDTANSSFRADIDWLVATGITKGCGSGTFCPSDPVTRGQMAAFLHRAMPGLPLIRADREFIDDAGTFEADIEWLYRTGVTSGCSPTTFCPSDPVTRGQMAAFLHRAMPGLPLIRADREFIDDAGTFEADIEWLYRTGVTSGCSPTTFCPSDPVTRGQMAAFLHRAIEAAP